LDNEDKMKEKLEILKLEISILSELINRVSDRLWTIRQIAVTIWLAAIGLGLGIIAKDNQPNLTILAVSILIPIWFAIIDSNYSYWVRIFISRDLQIGRFLSRNKYILPSNNTEISFDECLEKNELPFPIYDLTGSETYGDKNKYYKWRKSKLNIFTISSPLLIYGTQLILSALFFSSEYKRSSNSRLWWIPLLGTVTILVILTTLAHIKKNLSK